MDGLEPRLLLASDVASRAVALGQAAVSAAPIILIDPGAPPLAATLDPASDSGSSSSDGVTNVNRPRFLGTTVPGATVTVLSRTNGTGPVVALGSVVADAAGAWSLVSPPLADGAYAIFAQAVAAGGSGATTVQVLPGGNRGLLQIDTAGPRINAIRFLPSTGRIQVLLDGDASGVDATSLLTPANVTLRRIRRLPGGPRINHRAARYAATGVQFTPPTSPTTGQLALVSIENNRPIGSGVYRLTIGAGGVSDLAGNSLAGTYVATLTRSGRRVSVAAPAGTAPTTNLEIPPTQRLASTDGRPIP